jgi:hypothetical protein
MNLFASTCGTRVTDPDPHYVGKLDPDPHWSENLDPDPHSSEKQPGVGARYRPPDNWLAG